MMSRPDSRCCVLRRGPQDGHADATHHTSARARDAGIHVLPPERAMVARNDGAAESLDERGEGLVDLAVVAEVSFFKSQSASYNHLGPVVFSISPSTFVL